MTGRELIIYILQNRLEDQVVFGDEFLGGFMTPEEAAVKFEVGIETVVVWCIRKTIPFVIYDGKFLIPKNTSDPRKETKV